MQRRTEDKEFLDYWLCKEEMGQSQGWQVASRSFGRPPSGHQTGF